MKARAIQNAIVRLGFAMGLAATSSAALAADEYRLDDGLAETNIGLQGGGSNKSLAWLNHCVVTPGNETITHVNISFGNIPDNQPMTAYLWFDPNQDGDPDDAFVVSSIGGLTQGGGTNTFVKYDIPDATLNVGDSFFIGCIIDYYDPTNSRTPAALDLDGADSGIPYPPNNHSWIAGSTAGAVDPNNLDLAQIPVERIAVAMNQDGNWLVRADAPVPFTCPGTGDCYQANGTPGCNDASCCNAVCSIDPLCCTNTWDSLCANTAQQVCAGPGCSGLCPSGGSWQLASTGGPTARWGHAMTYDAVRQRTVLFGGGNSNQTWEWDGGAWIQRFPAVSPPGRTRPGLACDAANGVVVLFGGQDSTAYYGDTWIWNGANWQQAFPANSPGARVAFAMTYDSARQRIVLFGGQDAAGINHNDTWEWDGANWIQRFPVSAPSPRSFHDMTYDAARNVTVLYGGGPSGHDETWEWDGTNWTQRLPASNPGNRAGHKIVFDANRNVSVLYGGNLFGTNIDIWEWNGSNWTSTPDNSPGPRSEHDMAFHQANGKVVLFGGVTNGGAVGDTWMYPDGGVTQHYLIVGSPNGIGWSWTVTGPNTHVCDLFVPGVPSGQTTLDLAQAFAASINNAGCAGVSASAAPSGVPNAALFDITVLDNAPFDICLGPFGQTPTCCVAVVGSCSFNPDIHELVLSGEDCNANGMDDAIDLLSGGSVDDNGNGIPDECETQCISDLNHDGTTDAADLAILLGAWDSGDADLNLDGATDAADLAILLGAWGQCDEGGGSD